MEFRWEALPASLRELMPAEVSDGPPPAEDAVKALWPRLRDEWLLTDPGRTARFADLLDALDVGRTARGHADDDADFLRTVRNSTGLRHALVRYLVALGSPAPGPTDDPAEYAAAPDRPAAPQSAPGAARSPIPGPDFAPRTAADYSRLHGMNDLQWGLWMLHMFNAVGRLLPGESVVVRAMSGDVANNGQVEGGIAVSFAHGPGDGLILLLLPEPLLPQGVAYDPLWPGLEELGWKRESTGEVYAEFEWPEGADDAVAVAALTLRSVFLVDSAARLEMSDEIRPPAGLLPAPPAPEDVVQPESPAELLAVVGSIIRAVGGTVLTGADPTTHAFRMGPWTGWIHADAGAPILDAVVIVSDLSRPGGQSFDTARVLEIQSTGLRYGRVVLTDAQAVLAASAPFHAFTGRMVESFLNGLLEDAARATGLTVASTPATPGLGGYL